MGLQVMHEVPAMPHLARTVKDALRGGGTFLSVCPRGARAAAIEAFVAAWGPDEVDVREFPVVIMGRGEEWNFGSCEGDALVLITALVKRDT